MKDSESTTRSNKKANGRTGARIPTGSPNKNNGIAVSDRRTKTTKAMMGATSSRSTKTTNSTKAATTKTNKSPRKSNKQSPELRPRRRASQTYFFKYQLAKNPLKAEEEDLKQALLASLQQCSSNGISDNDSKDCIELMSADKKSKSQSKNKNSILVNKRPVGRPPKNSSSHTEENGFDELANNKPPEGKKKRTENGQSATSNGTNKRRGSVESNLSSRGSSYKDEAKKVKKKYDHRLLAGCPLKAIDRDLKTEKSRSKNSNLTSVQNKIKAAKKLLQNKQANKSKSNALIGKYSALRKFPSNSNTTLSPSAKRQGGSLLSSSTNNANSSKSKSKLSNFFQNNLSTTGGIANTTSNGNHFIPYSPYTPLQKKEPPDEDYLKKYKPETEDFLTFICFRTTAPNYQNKNLADTSNSCIDDTNNNCTTTNINYNNHSGNGKITDKQVPDPQNLKQCTSTLCRLTNINSSPTINDHHSPNNHRRPTRQSPRLASSNRKISENESSNHTIGTSATAYDNSITYEEDMKRASIALEDMAQEINSSDDIHNEVAQNSPDCISKSSSPYKNNKHLVKGLMTREFAGAFADEETIFESISNHKL